MTGVILCGGQSTRMGADKGLLTMQAETWAQSATAKMRALGFAVVLSVNPAQLQDYSLIFEPSILITDNASLDIRGPICGVLSIHKMYPAADLFVLACDMPFMEINILEQLIELYEKNKNYDAFIFSNNNEREPLCGIYTAKGLAHTLQLYEHNQLQKHSMKFMLDHLDTLLTPLKDEEKKYFRNINSHAALNGL